MEQHLLEAVSDGVATLTLNRPERLNALSTPIMDGLLEALPRLARDSAIGAIVLTGAGRAFCAGGDLKSMAEGRVERSMEEARRLSGDTQIASERQRHAGGDPSARQDGSVAAVARDSEAYHSHGEWTGRRRFVTAFANIGFSGDFGGSYFLSKLVGTGKARELYAQRQCLRRIERLSRIAAARHGRLTTVMLEAVSKLVVRRAARRVTPSPPSDRACRSLR